MTKNMLLLVRLAGLFISTPAIVHAQWVQTNGPSGGEITALFAKGDTILAAVDGGIQLSTDNGVHWSQSDILHAYVSSLSSDGANIFAATGLGVSRSTDYGMSWLPASHGLTSGLSSFAFLDAQIFAATDHGVFVSSDEGANWSRSDTIQDGVPSFGVSAITVCDTNIIIGCYLGSTAELTLRGIVRSCDKGKSWTSPDSGFTSDIITVLITQESNIFAATLKNGIFRSTSNSRRWNLATTGLSDKHVITLIAGNSNIFAGTWGGVYLSTNAGTEWKQVNSGLGDTSIMSLAASGKYLFAGTKNSGVWRRPLSEITTAPKQSANDLLSKFYLFQNYPNPFNPTTTISYSLPMATLVTLKVYDILGRHVKTLVYERQSEGVHSVPVSAGDLSSALYFYRLTAGDFASTKKFMVIK